MNQQPAGYPQYPPPAVPGQAAYPYEYAYPPPQRQSLAPTSQQPGQSFAYQHPYPPPRPQLQQSQQAQQFRGFPAPPPAQQTQPLPRPTPQVQRQERSTPQTRQQQQQQSAPRQDGARSPSSSPDADPGALGAEPTSPDLDTFDQQLINALNEDNNQPQSQQRGQAPDVPKLGDDNDAIYNLPAPPEMTYPSEQALEKALHDWSLEHGYELVRRASKNNAAGEQYKRYYNCSKYGKETRASKLRPEMRQRANKRTNRIGCPMSLAAVAVQPTMPKGEWQVRHRKTHHNHPAVDAVLLSGHRRRAREGGVQKAVDGLFAIGTSTVQVMQFLKNTNPDGLFTRTDVANMKLKWKKFGTCVVKPNEAEESQGPGAPARRPRGKPKACHHCRAKKQACGSERPICSACQKSGTECVYDPWLEPPPPAPPRQQQLSQAQDEMEVDAGVGNSRSTFTAPDSASQPQQEGQQAEPVSSRPPPPRPRGRPRKVVGPQNAATREIIADLRTFQAENAVPARYDLNSSTVDILAQSSCGTGESYNSLPILSTPADWPRFRDALVEAAMKENCHQVLIGARTEPIRPEMSSVEDNTRTDRKEIEAWNEYVKQLAIYKRRNQLLLSAMSSHMAPYYKNRVTNLQQANLVWDALEDVFQPRGCETAFKLYNDLHSITLANSQDLRDYIQRLQTTYDQFRALKLNTSPPSWNRVKANLPSAKMGDDAVPEEMICLLFLRNLGADWAKWVEGLIATNNIGGFGTGERLGLKDLCKRAVAYEAMQRRELGR